MATNAAWTIVFEDKLIIKQSGDGAGQYVIDVDTFCAPCGEFSILTYIYILLFFNV